ncbi:MAG: DUF6249 domain-containing protein [Odoribacter splanchnicus]
MNDLTAPIIVGIICATIYGLFELFARRRERITLIEKLVEIKSMGQIEGKIDFSFGRSFSCWGLRGGCLLIGLGLGIIVAYFLQITTMHGGDIGIEIADRKQVIYSGCVLFFGGLGLLIAFILEYKYFRKK